MGGLRKKDKHIVFYLFVYFLTKLQTCTQVQTGAVKLVLWRPAGCTWITCIWLRQRTNFTAPGCTNCKRPNKLLNTVTKTFLCLCCCQHPLRSVELKGDRFFHRWFCSERWLDATSIDEFRMVLGGQPTPCFLQQNSRKAILTLPVVNDNEIVRSTSEWVAGKPGLIARVWPRRAQEGSYRH